jgi:hypothetical protein
MLGSQNRPSSLFSHFLYIYIYPPNACPPDCEDFPDSDSGRLSTDKVSGSSKSIRPIPCIFRRSCCLGRADQAVLLTFRNCSRLPPNSTATGSIVFKRIRTSLAVLRQHSQAFHMRCSAPQHVWTIPKHLPAKQPLILPTSSIGGFRRAGT